MPVRRIYPVYNVDTTYSTRYGGGLATAYNSWLSTNVGHRGTLANFACGGTSGRYLLVFYWNTKRNVATTIWPKMTYGGVDVPMLSAYRANQDPVYAKHFGVFALKNPASGTNVLAITSPAGSWTCFALALKNVSTVVHGNATFMNAAVNTWVMPVPSYNSRDLMLCQAMSGKLVTAGGTWVHGTVLCSSVTVANDEDPSNDFNWCGVGQMQGTNGTIGTFVGTKFNLPGTTCAMIAVIAKSINP